MRRPVSLNVFPCFGVGFTPRIQGRVQSLHDGSVSKTERFPLATMWCCCVAVEVQPGTVSSLLSGKKEFQSSEYWSDISSVYKSGECRPMSFSLADVNLKEMLLTSKASDWMMCEAGHDNREAARWEGVTAV